ncbi:MAG: DUF1501 domain-containing protein [Verrucomicrobiota bacterium]
MDLTPNLHKADPKNRRNFLLQSAGALLGVSTSSSLSPLFGAPPENPTATAELSLRTRPAKRIISLFMQGGLSQIETFSPVPEAPIEIRGEARAISTSADGIQLGYQLPKTARLMHLAVPFRSLHSDQGAHEQGRYFMKTNRRMRGTIQHPHFGSWTGRLSPPLNKELPGFVAVTGSTLEVGAGFLGAKYEPLVVRDPESGLANTQLAYKDTAEAMNHRLNLAAAIDRDFQARYASVPVRNHAAMFKATTRLLDSKDLDAFDISQEPASRRKAYGSSRFGQGCLLARRLSTSVVRFVEVEMGGWDTHIDHFKRLPELLSSLDTGLSALLSDLDASGELEETLVVVTSEFGRTPFINQNEGRDHYPQAFSALIAGGGIRGGQAYGGVSKDGQFITNKATKVTTFNATLGWALGLPINETIFSPSQRPFTLASRAKPITELFRV